MAATAPTQPTPPTEAPAAATGEPDASAVETGASIHLQKHYRGFAARKEFRSKMAEKSDGESRVTQSLLAASFPNMLLQLTDAKVLMQRLEAKAIRKHSMKGGKPPVAAKDRKFTNYSLFCLAPDNPVRVRCIKICLSKPFETFIMFLILARGRPRRPSAPAHASALARAVRARVRACVSLCLCLSVSPQRPCARPALHPALHPRWPRARPGSACWPPDLPTHSHALTPRISVSRAPRPTAWCCAWATRCA